MTFLSHITKLWMFELEGGVKMAIKAVSYLKQLK